MEPQTSDQERFDDEVARVGRLIVQIAAGVGIFAALMLSTIALIRTTDRPAVTSSMSGMPRAGASLPAALPSRADVVIEHVTRGCHAMLVNGQADPTPTATIRLASGGRLQVTDNDVMPHRLLETSGPAAQFSGAAMGHMGAQSTVTFPRPGTYSLTTKAGEDYTTGITTVGPDNTLHLKVLVTA